MNREDIIRMAREADAYADAMDIGGKNYIGLRDEYFAALVAAAAKADENEACAKECDELAGMLFGHGDKSGAEIAVSLRDTIRARKENT